MARLKNKQVEEIESLWPADVKICFVGPGEGRSTEGGILYTTGVSSCTVLMGRIDCIDGKTVGMLTHFPFFSWKSTVDKFKELVNDTVKAPTHFEITLLVNNDFLDKFLERPDMLQSFKPMVESLLGENGTIKTIGYAPFELGEERKGIAVRFVAKDGKWETCRDGIPSLNSDMPDLCIRP